MPEESLETREMHEAVEEAVERAEHGAQWVQYLSLSTVIIAVLAAIASLQSGSLANEALLIKNEAVLVQAKASDQWAYYQANGIKGNLALAMADVLKGKGGNYKEDSEKYKEEQAEIKKSAEELEAKVKESNTEAGELLEHHHKFAYAVTLYQVAISLSAIAAMTRRKMLWGAGLLIALAGTGFFVTGFL